MDVCKSKVSLRHGGTLNIHRATSPHVRLVELEERREALTHPPSCFSSKLGWKWAKPYCHLSGPQSYG
ncbi:hypothetical protein TNCV_1490721 [Trichonephila clavipes]|nr:hypothetical protein TNCV_1490721 [Trichonephila clavipes]